MPVENTSMKTLLLALSLVFASALSAQTPAAPAAAYPLDTCVVSGEKLGGDMGEPYDYVYKQAGQPDQLVRFCCKACLKDFLKEPAVYLEMIKAAEKSGATTTGVSAKADAKACCSDDKACCAEGSAECCTDKKDCCAKSA